MDQNIKLIQCRRSNKQLDVFDLLKSKNRYHYKHYILQENQNSHTTEKIIVSQTITGAHNHPSTSIHTKLGGAPQKLTFSIGVIITKS
jgi:hypothetical protein